MFTLNDRVRLHTPGAPPEARIGARGTIVAVHRGIDEPNRYDVRFDDGGAGIWEEAELRPVNESDERMARRQEAGERLLAALREYVTAIFEE